MRLKIESEMIGDVDELRCRDGDAFELLQLWYLDFGESVFVVARRKMPGGEWSDDRFYGATIRLIAKGFIVAVAETLH